VEEQMKRKKFGRKNKLQILGKKKCKTTNPKNVGMAVRNFQRILFY